MLSRKIRYSYRRTEQPWVVEEGHCSLLIAHCVKKHLPILPEQKQRSRRSFFHDARPYRLERGASQRGAGSSLLVDTFQTGRAIPCYEQSDSGLFFPSVQRINPEAPLSDLR